MSEETPLHALILSEDPKLSSAIRFALEGNYGMNVKDIASPADAIDMLSFGPPDYDFLVTDFDRFGKHMMTLNASLKGKTTQFIFWTIEETPDQPEAKGNVHFIRANHLIQDLRATVQKLFPNIGKTSEDILREDQLFRIRTSLLLPTSPLVGDVYVQLSPVKFVKLLKAGDVFDTHDLIRYQTQKKIEFMFVSKEAREPFLNKLTAAIIAWITAPETPNITPPSLMPTETPLTTEEPQAPKREASVQEKHALLEREFKKNPNIAMELLREACKEDGFGQEVQGLASACVQQVISSAKENPKLGDLFGRLKRDREKYISVHSMITAVTACILAAHMDWNSDSTFQKLTLAAMLHDITLRNNELAKVKTLDELKSRSNDFSEIEQTDFRFHTTRAAELSRTIHDIPPDVDSIINEHHERPNGTGFPRQLKHPRIGPLSAVFIIAHDLVDYLLESNSDTKITQKTLQAFFERNTSVYEFGNFKKVLRCVMKLELDDEA